MRERPTVATQHTVNRPHHQPTAWDAHSALIGGTHR